MYGTPSTVGRLTPAGVGAPRGPLIGQETFDRTGEVRPTRDDGWNDERATHERPAMVLWVAFGTRNGPPGCRSSDVRPLRGLCAGDDAPAALELVCAAGRPAVSATLWLAALAALLVLAIFGGWAAAEVSCRRRWRRYAAAGSLRLHGRAPGWRQGYHRDVAGTEGMKSSLDGSVLHGRPRPEVPPSSRSYSMYSPSKAQLAPPQVSPDER